MKVVGFFIGLLRGGEEEEVVVILSVVANILFLESYELNYHH